MAIVLAARRPDLVACLVLAEANLDARPRATAGSSGIAAFTEEELVHGGGFARVLWRVGPRWAAAMRLADRVAPHRTASPLLRERSGHARTAALVARSAHLPAG